MYWKWDSTYPLPVPQLKWRIYSDWTQVSRRSIRIRRRREESQFHWSSPARSPVTIETLKEMPLEAANTKLPVKETAQTTNTDIFTKFLLCFSLISDGRAILSLDTPSKVLVQIQIRLIVGTKIWPLQNSIPSLHGPRALITLGIILGHTFWYFSHLKENGESLPFNFLFPNAPLTATPPSSTK